MKVINIKEISGVNIGNTQNCEAGTGCTVILCQNGACAGLDVRGGGPASRESQLLQPLAAADQIHAILLSGGSAFGLDAAGGVQKYLEERGIGVDVGVTKVPLVCQSCLFDLTVADALVRPDAAMGYEACIEAQKENYQDGNFGAGTAATVGKFYGMDFCMKSGIGSYAIQTGDLQIGAVVAVNAWGDIYDWKNGQKIAGLLSKDKKSFRSTQEEILKSYQVVDNKFVGNTTIGVIITNGDFHKNQLNKIASMAQDGMARVICPVHTSVDGDSIYALSAGKVKADQDVVGTLAAQVFSEAILCAVKSAKGAYGYPSVNDVKKNWRNER